jgi:hypothetical protein
MDIETHVCRGFETTGCQDFIFVKELTLGGAHVQEYNSRIEIGDKIPSKKGTV